MKVDAEGIKAAATAVRCLTMDAVQKAGSGHPGLPLGCAELGVLIYGEILKHYPKDPAWIDRDRFVLSAGHGSMLLYSLLHLSGYDLGLEEIKSFRQLGSRTPGHPEYRLTPGVETTTGPLGQGIGNAVGMAIAERMLAARFNTPQCPLIDHYTFVLAGDGDLMEGVSAEACSLAGHLGLGKLIVFYDSNRITIEGSTDLAFTEDVSQRFASYGWQTLQGDAYDIAGIMELVRSAKKELKRPTLIMLRSLIAKGAPNLAGSHEAHGAPLGEEEVRKTKRALGVSEDQDFFVPPAARAYFDSKQDAWRKEHEAWQARHQAWARENPEGADLWSLYWNGGGPSPRIEWPRYRAGDKAATRKASGEALNAITKSLPNLVGGSADLAPSNSTSLKGLGSFQKDNPSGRNLHFGVREHGMGAVVNGISLHGGLRPFCATFLVFSDYMRPAIRLASLMKLPVIYIFTHDSIYVGEDGPTHQPVEHLAALRTIPGLTVLRPGDAEETNAAWQIALENKDGPTALILTRQNLTVYPKEDPAWAENLRRGAYAVKEPAGELDTVIVATGSEVGMALEARELLGGEGVRVVSMISRELFLKQTKAFRESLLPDGALIVTLEAGISQGWRDIGRDRGLVQSIDRFGESAPAAKLADHLQFTAKTLVEKIRARRS